MPHHQWDKMCLWMQRSCKTDILAWPLFLRIMQLHRRRGRKTVKVRVGEVLWNCLQYRTRPLYALDHGGCDCLQRTCTRWSQSEFHKDAQWAHGPLCSAEEQLAVDVSARGCQLSLRSWPTVNWSCSVDGLIPCNLGQK